MKTVLVIRRYPSCLSWPLIGHLKSFFNLFWLVSKKINGHKVIFFFPGYKGKRKIPSRIIEGIDSGEITDVVDFGAGGAINPRLQVGDLVLSKGEVYPSRLEMAAVNRRPEAEDVLAKIAEEEGRKFWRARIITLDKWLSTRKERREYLEVAGVVQMEHTRVISNIIRVCKSEAFCSLYFTHIELISDAVPRGNMSLWEITKVFIHIFLVYFFEKDLGRLRAKFLKEFLA